MDYYKSAHKSLSKINTIDSTFSILTDEIIEVVTDSTEAYTFRIEVPTHAISLFENFVIEKFNNGTYKFYIYRYRDNPETTRFSDLDEDVILMTRELINSSRIDLDDFNDYIAQKLIYDESSGCLFSLEQDEDCSCEYLYVLQCDNINPGGGGSDGDGSGGGSSDGDGDSSGGSGGGGGSSGGGSGNGGGSTVGVLSSDNTPCDKVNRLNTNIPTLKQELLNLKNIVDTSPTERGKYKLNSTSIIQNAPVGVNGEVVLINPSGNQKYEMIAHTHNAPAEDTYSVFSYEDLYALSQLLREGKIDTNNFVAYLITADGTNYALTIDNPTQFSNTFAIATDRAFDMNIAVNRVTQRTLYYSGDEDVEPLIKEDNTSNTDDQKLFLDFVKNTNMGLSLFEISDDFETYKKLTNNPFTGDIDKTNCN